MLGREIEAEELELGLSEADGEVEAEGLIEGAGTRTGES